MKKKIIVMLILIVIVIISIIMLLLGLRKTPQSSIIGSWTTDGVTIYEFSKHNKGKLIASLKEYEFTYKIDNDTLAIDFKNEKSKDTTYTYTFEDNKLILEGENGRFTFIKKDDKKKKDK